MAGLKDQARDYEEAKALDGVTVYLRYPERRVDLQDVVDAQSVLNDVDPEDHNARLDAMENVAAACVSITARDAPGDQERAIDTSEARNYLRRCVVAEKARSVFHLEITKKAMQVCGLSEAIDRLGKALDQSE